MGLSKESFFLFADCFLVNGATNMSICDTGRQEMYVLPNKCYEVLKSLAGSDVAAVRSQYGEQLVDDLISFSLQKELGFLSDVSKSRFPPLSEKTENYRRVSNAIIDIREKLHDFSAIIPALSAMGCISLQIRIYGHVSMEYLISSLDEVHRSPITSVELYLQSSNFTHEQRCRILEKHACISNMIVFGSDQSGSVDHAHHSSLFNMSGLHETTQTMSSCEDCGKINLKSMVVGTPQTFLEFKYYNSCLYQKVSVSEEGDIKNCPSMEKSYGKIGEISLSSVVSSEAFQHYSTINKDQIAVCKDCEYRYVCSDCRAYTENGLYDKPLKCSYDPYSGVWG